ncbi:AHH domain-containing protein [Piscinibacter sp. HJYY11]|uniref:AHH domain-containing protein n=1 Tax=Piscinibacter sp. HJYY11 TaxID=2801333 RepID=UPI00191CD14E|nr:AHH domain-containing protein [Piscinibacter sp. HJYY11]MBL0726143.1 AHH domain-containing protein [Piscinibacter sp. HJYY11]
MIGSVVKGTTYLKDLKLEILKVPSHPRHHGVKMQAHHLVSQEGVRISGLGAKLVSMGYNIDHVKNLAFLPCTLQGACHLGIQPHRGDHTAKSDRPTLKVFNLSEDDYDDDDDHPESYHVHVAKLLAATVRRLKRECDGDPDMSSKFRKGINGLSKSILETLSDEPSELRLTSIAEYFKRGVKIGCSGADSVGDHKHSTACQVGRNHLKGRRATGQKDEGIKYQSSEHYVPKPSQ